MSLCDCTNGTRTKKEEQKKKSKYNTRDSLVVTDPATNLAVTGLSLGERTGSRAFLCLWSYLILLDLNIVYIDRWEVGEHKGRSR